MAGDQDTRPVRRLPVVPYSDPEPWVPSGGFGEFRTPEQQQHDGDLAAQHDADEAQEADELDAEG